MTRMDILLKNFDDYLLDFEVNKEIYVEEVQAYLEGITSNNNMVTQVKELLKLRGYTKILEKRQHQMQENSSVQEELDSDINFFALLEDNKEDLLLVESLQSNYAKNNYLITQYQTHEDEAILIELVNMNMGLVKKEVLKFNKLVNHKLSEEDLVQEGILGLIEGIGRFDVDKGFMMSTYVTYYIRKNIIRAIFNTGHTVRLPVHVFEAILKLRKVEKEALFLNEDEYYILQKLEITKEKYLSLKKFEAAYIKMTSINTIVSENGGTTELFELLDPLEAEIVGGNQSELLQSPLEKCIEDEEKIFLHEIIANLTEKEANIIRYRFGFYNDRIYTLEDIGKVYGVTRERIRQIELKTLTKLSNKVMHSKFFSVE